jgi:hypothetical protein
LLTILLIVVPTLQAALVFLFAISLASLPRIQAE